MDKIILEGMEFYGFHGVLKAEQELGQRFVVDLEMKLDLNQAGLTDDLNHTINYALVYSQVKEVVETERYALIEALAQRIAELILDKFKVERVKVRINKPQAPIPGIFKNVAVEIKRKHEG